MTGVGKNSSFIKNTTLTTASQICGLLATAVGGVLTARYLGPEGKGQVALAMTVPGIVAMESARRDGEQLPIPSFDRA